MLDFCEEIYQAIMTNIGSRNGGKLADRVVKSKRYGDRRIQVRLTVINGVGGVTGKANFVNCVIDLVVPVGQPDDPKWQQALSDPKWHHALKYVIQHEIGHCFDPGVGRKPLIGQTGEMDPNGVPVVDKMDDYIKSDVETTTDIPSFATAIIRVLRSTGFVDNQIKDIITHNISRLDEYIDSRRLRVVLSRRDLQIKLANALIRLLDGRDLDVPRPQKAYYPPVGASFMISIGGIIQYMGNEIKADKAIRSAGDVTVYILGEGGYDVRLYFDHGTLVETEGSREATRYKYQKRDSWVMPLGLIKAAHKPQPDIV